MPAQVTGPTELPDAVHAGVIFLKLGTIGRYMEDDLRLGSAALYPVNSDFVTVSAATIRRDGSESPVKIELETGWVDFKQLGGSMSSYSKRSCAFWDVTR